MKSPVLKLRLITQLIIATLIIGGAILSPSLGNAQCSPDVVGPSFTFCPSNVVLTTNGDTNSCQGRKYNWNAEMVDQQSAQTSGSVYGAVSWMWQSFTAGTTGALTAIEVWLCSFSTQNVTLTIYNGVGTGGTVVYSQVHNIPGAGASGCNLTNGTKINLSGVSKPILTAGQTYSFGITYTSGGPQVGIVSGTRPMNSSYGTNPANEIRFKVYRAPKMVTATDNCNLVSITSSHPSTQYFPVGTTTVTHTATDATGNSSTCSFDITVVDTHGPNINSVPANIVTGNGIGQCGKNVTWTAPVPTDGCGISTFTTDHASGSFFPIGTTAVTYTATNTLGNTSTASFNVTVNDNQGPTADIASLPTITGQCSATVSTTPTATDNCDGPRIGTTTDPLTYNTDGTYIVHWTYTDTRGNTTIQNQTVIVDDNIAPVANITTLPTLTGQCSVTVSTVPTATDNCGGTITATTISPLVYNSEGTFTVAWKYNDGRGNITTQNQTVIVDDNIAPVPNAGSLPLVTGTCSASVGAAPTATDNCAGTITATTANPTTYTVDGIYTITWTYNDGRGNTSTQTQTVLVDDATAPVPNVSSLPTMSNDCSVTLTAPTASDNCAGTVTATTANPTTYNTNGTYNVLWTYNDGRGNTVTQNQQVIINDVTAPIPFPGSLPTINGQCATTLTAPLAVDNCAGTISATTIDPMTYIAEGTYTVHWIYNDGNGNTAALNQTVVIDDVTAPVPNISSLPTINSQCTVNLTAPMATDNCIGSVAATTVDPTSYSAEGTYIVHWSYTDGRGNTSTQNQTVIVNDITAPVPTISSLPTVTGQCSASVTVPSATDNCIGTVTATTVDPTTYNTEGTYIVHWSYDDGRGNTSTQNQTVIVDDVTAPVPTVASLSTLTNECSVTVTAPTATDNCSGGTITATTVDPTTYSAEGTYTVHWIYNDGRGNTTLQNQTVVINDITAPVANISSLPAIMGECSVTATPPTATDACAGTIIATTTDPLTYNTQGFFVITWIYNDGRGNTSSQNQVVVVDDNTAPVANIPVLSTITAECSATVTAPSATDACAGTITATTVDPTTYNTQGTFTVHWTYNDGNGNSSNQNQTVIIDDNTAPVANIPVLSTITSECSASVTAPSATDACVGSITATTADPTTYNTQGTFTVHWTYSDGNGNSSTQNQTVIIDDNTAPVANIPVLSTITSECSATVTAPSATDACVGSVTATTVDPTTYNTQGTFTVHWTYNDGNGNTSTQDQTVIIDDNTAPVANIPVLSTITSECSATVTAPSATDACAGAITATTVDPTTYNTQGTYTVHWTYSDGNGNSSTQNQTVIIDDNTAPIANIPVLSNATGDCSVTVTAPTATDACAGTITATTADPTSYSAQGTYTVLWTYNDGNGNNSTQTQTIIVDDLTAPAANIPVLSTITGDCSATVTAPTATDACAGTITATTADPTSYSVQGTYTVLWTYNDGNGNTSTQTQTVIVDDVTAPVADQVSLPTVTNECSASVIAPTATDACTGTITATTSDPTTYNTQGTFTVTWTYNDGNGNTSTQTQTVTINDVTDPVPTISSLPTVTGNCTVTLTPPTAADNCSGTVTATTTDPTFYNVAGTYSVTWTYTDGNGNTSTQSQQVVVDPCLGVEESGENLSINVYPNPGNGIFTLSLSSMPNDGAQMRVVDELGQVVYTNNIQQENQVYDLSYLKAATYYVQVINHNIVITKILIITNQY